MIFQLVSIGVSRDRIVCTSCHLKYISIFLSSLMWKGSPSGLHHLPLLSASVLQPGSAWQPMAFLKGRGSGHGGSMPTWPLSWPVRTTWWLSSPTRSVARGAVARPSMRTTRRAWRRSGDAHLASGGALACVLGRSKEQSGGRHDNFFGDEGTSRWRATPLWARALATYGVTHGGTVVAHAWQRGLAAAVGKG